uniref:Uncharacterized protein n=1 Tax=Tetranychus urticae TaxID=32264 RepID=T1KYG4_TETUR
MLLFLLLLLSVIIELKGKISTNLTEFYMDVKRKQQ